jgi:hypothetical protein
MVVAAQHEHGAAFDREGVGGRALHKDRVAEPQVAGLRHERQRCRLESRGARRQSVVGVGEPVVVQHVAPVAAVKPRELADADGRGRTRCTEATARHRREAGLGRRKDILAKHQLGRQVDDGFGSNRGARGGCHCDEREHANRRASLFFHRTSLGPTSPGRVEPAQHFAAVARRRGHDRRRPPTTARDIRPRRSGRRAFRRDASRRSRR